MANTQLHDRDLLRDKAYVDGSWIAADSGRSFPVRNPASGDEIAQVPDLGVAEVRRAIEAANAAYPAWRAKTAKERAAVLRRWYDLIMQNQEDLAILMTSEQG
jgi:succinate-semialdehyde dehydrogenase/glutarate-semialdehyde dehydrogenase